MKIRITSTPPGEAPEHIRQAWIGLEIPVPQRFAGQRRSMGLGVLSGPKSWPGVLLAVITGRAKRRNGYIVEASNAVELLAARAPEAADWWRKNTPRLVQPGRYFLFAAEACEEVQEPMIGMPLQPKDPAIWHATLPHDEAVMQVCMASENGSGYVREAALVQMATAPDRRYIPFILRRLGDWVPQVRAQAKKTLAKYKAAEFRKGGLRAIHDVESLLRVKRIDLASEYHEVMRWLVHEVEPAQLLNEVRGLDDSSRFRVIRYLLAEHTCREVMLRTFLSDRSFLIRLATVQHVATLAEDWSIGSLESALNDRSPSVRTSALKELIRRDRATPAELTLGLTDPSFDVRDMAAKRIGLSRDALLEHYRKHLKGGDRMVGCLLGLRDLKGSECVTDVLSYAAHSDPAVRQAALMALAGLAPDHAYERAMSMIVDRNRRIREKAEAILLERHDQAVVDRARALMGSEQVMHRLAGMSLLNKFGGWALLPDTLRACLDGSPRIADQAWVNLNAWVAYARRLFTDAPTQDLERARMALNEVRAGLAEPTYAQRNTLDAIQVFLN